MDAVSFRERLDAALSAAPADARDDVAVALAEAYADALDAADRSGIVGTLAEIGPKLLAALAALGMTATARKAVTGGPGVRPRTALDDLRERRAARQHDATPVDGAAG